MGKGGLGRASDRAWLLSALTGLDPQAAHSLLAKGGATGKADGAQWQTTLPEHWTPGARERLRQGWTCGLCGLRNFNERVSCVRTACTGLPPHRA